MIIKLKAGADDAGRRLDRVLRKSLPDYSLSLIHRLLRQGKVLVNNTKAGPNERIQPDMVIQVQCESVVNHNLERVNDNAVNYRYKLVNKSNGAMAKNTVVNYRYQRINKSDNPPPLLPEILWRGAGIIVFNKPPGLASHGKDSLDVMVNTWLEGTRPPSLSFRPGPLHRLDKPSSGAIAFSETLEGAQWFSRLLRERKIIKTYLAIVEGRITAENVWRDELIRDRTIKKTLVNSSQIMVNNEQKQQVAITTVQALASDGVYTLIEARIITGRTHQIRSQAAAHGHPLAGDAKYGGKKRRGGLCLHAWKLELVEPIKGFPQPLIAPLPASLQSQIENLFGKRV